MYWHNSLQCDENVDFFLDILEKANQGNQQKHSSFTFNLLQPDINDKIIRLDDSSGLSKQWNTTTNTDSTIQPNFQHQYVSKSRVIGSNILNSNMKNEIMKEKNYRQYHLSKRKLLSILSLHSSTESSVYSKPLRSSSNKTDEHITQLENVNPQKEPFGEKSTNKNRSSLHNLKGPSSLNPPTFQTVNVSLLRFLSLLFLSFVLIFLSLDALLMAILLYYHKICKKEEHFLKLCGKLFNFFCINSIGIEMHFLKGTNYIYLQFTFAESSHIIALLCERTSSVDPLRLLIVIWIRIRQVCH